MAIYFALIISVMFVSMFSPFIFGSNQEKKSRFVVFFSCLLIFVIQALRDPSIGVDVSAYLSRFESMSRLSLFEAKSIFPNFEWGYLVFSKVFSHVLPNSQWYLAVIALLIIAPIGYVIHKNSKMPGLSVLLYITLGLFTFSFSGLRQAIALGISFYSFMFIKQNKPFIFFFFVILATSFHFSAIVFVPAYWIFKLRIKRVHLPVICVLLLVLFFLKDQITLPIVSFLFPRYVSDLEPTSAINMFFIMLSIYFASVVFGQKHKQDSCSAAYRNYMLMAVVIQLFASLSPIIMRMGFYYFIFVTLLIPDVIYSQRERVLRITASLITVAATIFFFYYTTSGGYLNVVPYKFF